MSEEKVSTKWMLSEMFSRWSDKVWFQVLSCVIVIYLLMAPIIGPVIYKYVNQVTLEESIDKKNSENLEKHKIMYNQSRETYANIRHVMKDYLKRIDCEYIFLLEYHNGTENIITGIPFCRFDVTVEVSEDGVPFVPIDKFRDDIVARYDILMSEELENGVFYVKDEFEEVDKYFAYQLQTIGAESYALINMEDKEGKVFASLLCVSTNQHMNRNEIHRCKNTIWKLMVVDFNNELK